MTDRGNVSGAGYDSFVKAFREKRIDWGGRNRVLVTDELGITTSYICIWDGRLKIPAVCYDDVNHNRAILGERNPWKAVDGSDKRSKLVMGFGINCN